MTEEVGGGVGGEKTKSLCSLTPVRRVDLDVNLATVNYASLPPLSMKRLSLQSGRYEQRYLYFRSVIWIHNRANRHKRLAKSLFTSSAQDLGRISVSRDQSRKDRIFTFTDTDNHSVSCTRGRLHAHARAQTSFCTYLKKPHRHTFINASAHRHRRRHTHTLWLSSTLYSSPSLSRGRRCPR